MIHIACCFDNNFELPFIVLASSIERHTRSPVTVHALHEGALRYAVNGIRKSELFQCHFKDISGAFRGFPTFGHPAQCTYARLALKDILPGIPRVLYLDVDMVVTRDLDELYRTDLGGKPLGAVIDYPLAARALKGDEFQARGKPKDIRAYLTEFIGLPDFLSYFNTGVLLIDTEKFGDEKLQRNIANFISDNASRLMFNEQDALNFVLKGRFKVLDPRWNVMSNELVAATSGWSAPAAMAEALKLSEQPWIVHYAGQKPWEVSSSLRPSDKLFWEEVSNHTSTEWLLITKSLRSVGGSSFSKFERYARRIVTLCRRHGALGILRSFARHRMSVSRE